MERRSVLKTIGGIGITGAIGLGATAFSGGAAASSSSLNIKGTALSNDDGDVTQVSVSVDHTASWDGFDEAVDAVAYRDVIKQINGDGSVGATHVLYDITDAPVLLDNWSSDGSGSDGWGGPGEHTSGPGTNGDVNATIDWTVLAEDPSSAAQSVETPGDIDDFGLDNGDDGTDKTVKLRYVKQVSFYAEDSGGSYTSDDGSTTLALMGGDDGTRRRTTSEGDFTVTVTNEGATTSSGGTGSSSAK